MRKTSPLGRGMCFYLLPGDLRVRLASALTADVPGGVVRLREVLDEIPRLELVVLGLLPLRDVAALLAGHVRLLEQILCVLIGKAGPTLRIGTLVRDLDRDFFPAIDVR